MTTMTKKTIATYENDVTLFDPSWASVIESKVTEFVIDGKTDGFATIEGSTIVKRLWADQAAAEEWVLFMTNINSQYSIPSSFNIIDI